MNFINIGKEKNHNETQLYNNNRLNVQNINIACEVLLKLQQMSMRCHNSNYK